MTEPSQEEGVQKVPPRARRRRWPLLAAAGVVAATGTLALVALDRPTGEASGLVATQVHDTAAVATSDPLRAELLRCRTLPPGADDPACRAAWDESRRQFFGEPNAAPSTDTQPSPEPRASAATAPVSAATSSPTHEEH